MVDSNLKKNEFNQDSITPEFNTAFDTLKQLSLIEWSLDNAYGDALEEIRTLGTFNNFHKCYDILCAYYDRLRPFMFSTYLKESDDLELDLKKSYEKWVDNKLNYMPSILMDKIRNFKRKLYLIKQQKLKIGIPIRRELSTEQKLNRAVD